MVMQKDLNRDRVGVPWLSQVRTRHWPLIVLPCQSFLKWALGNWLFPFIVIYRPSRASNKGGWGDSRVALDAQPRATWPKPSRLGGRVELGQCRDEAACARACITNESNLRNSVG